MAPERHQQHISSSSGCFHPWTNRTTRKKHQDLHHLHLLTSPSLTRTLVMDIPIQIPWYRRAFNPRLADLASVESLSDWPLSWPFSLPLPWMRPMTQRWLNWPENGLTEMRVEKDRYVIYLDVKHFSPEELSVNVSGDFITIHAKHEERQDDHGFVSREFLRKYKLPASVSGGDVTSSFSCDGLLTITVPRSSSNLERSIPITFDDGAAKANK
ncbi:alpha-crystallin A chain-like [Gadus macrocephalus]|uniref:alpha-crystallin A chain-like n=1 Tax=Gadus macrocephalus TaxID=80720 RepID=UPI0028CBAE72|nr:alpha-crystallin A chain-like [Gadus macrocephalus]